MQHVRRVIAASLTAPLLFLSGCGSEPEKPASGPTKANPSTASQHSESPKVETPEAFIRRWFDEDATMQNSGVARDYLALTSGCRPCKTLARRITGIYKSGGYVKTRGAKVLATEQVGTQGPRTAFDVRTDTAPTKYAESNGGAVQSLPGGLIVYRVSLERLPHGWRVTDYKELGQ